MLNNELFFVHARSSSPCNDAMPRLSIVDSFAHIDANAWDTLLAHNGGSPFMRHAYLDALIATECASARTGWQPRILLLERDGQLCGAMPLFEKTHSYGEYVFDWAWAEAYQRHGLAYYPKLLCAVPFTPVNGTRILAADAADRQQLIAAALQHAQPFSSMHVLFAPPNDIDALQSQGLLLRRTVQFHWQNMGDQDFDAFLMRMTHQRRKNIRQERRKVAEAGIRFRTLTGRDITAAHWAFFHRCYLQTYRAHRSSPYLSLAFFERLSQYMPENVLLFLAEREGTPIGAAFNVRDDTALYGRYWGSIEYVPLLHFEACYYQAIEYAITHGLQRFEGGAQGEHKLFRGLLPVETYSAHWLAHPQFARAIEDYLERESAGIEGYVNELNEHSPFRAGHA